MKKILAGLIVSTFLLSTAVAVFASGIGVWESKTGDDKWLVCKEKTVPVAVVDLFYTHGMTVASNTWDKAFKIGECLAIKGEMMPQAVVYRRDDMRIVRVAKENPDKTFTNYYWFTFDAIVGEPVIE